MAPLHAGDWLKVVDARRGAELVLARSAARFVTHEAAALFRDAALMMQKAVITGNVIAFLEADKSLDTAMARAAENAFASRLVAPLQTHSRRFWFRYQADTGLAEAANGHLAVIKAVTDGDGDGAEQATGRLMDLLRANAEEAAGS